MVCRMTFWEFADRSPFLVGFVVLAVCISAVDIAGHMRGWFKR